MVRMFLREPGSAAITVVTLSVTLTACLAVYRVVDAVLLSPLPFPDSDRLVAVQEWNRDGSYDSPVSPGTFQEWRRHSFTFSSLSCFRMQRRLSQASDRARSVWVAMVSPGFFRTLRVLPAIGRDFREESLHGRFADREIVLSHRFWVDFLAGRRDAVGRSIRLDEDVYQVVGVMPEDFEFPAGVDAWIPLVFNERVGRRQRTVRNLGVIGRLLDGVGIEAGEEDLRRISKLLEAEFPHSNRGWEVRIVPLKEKVVGPLRPALYLLVAGTGCLIAVAVFGLLQLFLAREVRRRREVAVYYSLGATPIRRLIETFGCLLPISGFGAFLGLALAHWVLCLLAIRLRAILPGIRLEGIDAEWIGVAFFLAAGLAAVMSLPSGFPPPESALAESLRGGEGVTVPRRAARVRSILVFVQAMGASVLLILMVCTVRSFTHLYTVDLPMDVKRTWVARVDVHWSDDERPWSRIVHFIGRLEAELQTLSGIESGAIASFVPFDTRVFKVPFRLAPPGKVSSPSGTGQQEAFSAKSTAAVIKVSPRYFETMNLPVLKGRVFDEHDRLTEFTHWERGIGHAVVNEAFARRFLEGGGGRVELQINLDWVGRREIIGIVGNARNSDALNSDVPEIYVPFSESPDGAIFLFLRTTDATPPDWDDLERWIQELHPDAVISEMSSLEGRIAARFTRQRIGGGVFSAFALVAFFLVLLALYGVTSHLLVEDRRAVLIRVVLGASQADVIRVFAPPVFLPAVAGIAVGIPVVLALESRLEPLYFAATPSDSGWLFSTVAILVLAFAVACAVPVVRGFPGELATELKKC